MSFTFRPAIRQHTPLIIGLAGPTKSGKTYSALRLATGLARGGQIAMVNAEGPRGHQYADTFKYLATELDAPFRPAKYTEALKAAADCGGSGPVPRSTAVVIVDSASHMHDGPGGILEWHEEILDRMTGTDQAKRQRATFAAWVEPKAAENHFIYQMLSMTVPVILCLRAKEKIKIAKSQVIDLGWQPIVGERVAFETIFTLMLPPHSKGVPDLAISDMREPFDELVPTDRPLDEALGERLAKWAEGTTLTREPDRHAPEPGPLIGSTAVAPAQRTGESGAPVARESFPEQDERTALLLRIRRHPESRVKVLCKRLLDSPEINLMKCDVAALKTLAEHLDA